MSQPSSAQPRTSSPSASGYLSPLLSTPGAVAARGADEGVAGHYGDPLREQRTLAGSAGLVDLSHRAVVQVSGVDRLSWLHNLSTQKLEALPPGVGADALILSPQGHVEHHLQLVDDGTSVWIHLEHDAAAPLVAFLDSMRFMLRVDVADVSDEWAVVWEPLKVARQDLVARVDPQDDAVAGRQVFVPRSSLESYAAGRPLAGSLALEALRIEAGRPRFGLDTDHKTIPHEVGWIGNAVVLNKGCYRGQETVARVANLGRPPRRLVRLLLDGSREGLPERGASVSVDDAAVVGSVTSAAYHHELGPIALALVKYGTDDAAKPTVGIGDDLVAAAIESVVAQADAPPPGQVARAAFRLK
jgi:folate-binding protein YgfZ